MLRKIAMLVVFISTGLYAQEENNNKSSQRPLRTQFDGMPIANIQYGYMRSSDYTLKMKHPENGLFEEGRIDNIERVNVSLDVPLFRKNKFFVSAFSGYNYSVTDYKSVDRLPVSFVTLHHPLHQETHYFKGGGTVTYFTRLGDKMLILSASAAGNGSKKRVENLNGLFTATLTLIQRENTFMALGVYGTTSQAAQIPIFPLLSYRHRIAGTPYIIDVILPKQAYMTRLVGEKGRLSAGFSLDVENGYFYPNQQGFKDTYTYDRIDLKLESKYEYLIGKNIIANASLALLKCYQGVYREKNSTKDVVRFNQDAELYMNVGIKYILK